MWWLFFACHEAPTRDPGLTVDQIARRLPADLDDRAGWAADVRAAVVAANRVPDEDAVCRVLAVVEQESTYRADPPVPGLGRVVRAEVDRRLASLGPLEGAARRELLDVVAPGHDHTFGERLGAVRTEHEVDLLYREIVEHQRARAPALAFVADVLFPRSIERFDPVETAGSMQVSVAWAQAASPDEDPAVVREALYTRAGGLRSGAARLFAHELADDEPVYRFADYNAGLYASRNAAVQARLAGLTDRRLALDGDLLRWTDRGRPARRQEGETVAAFRAWRDARHPELGDEVLLAELELEKEAAFEDTATWALLWADAVAAGAAPAYARVPDVALDSPKLAGHKTTAWFASNVERRYGACLDRG
jgi:hypothetical protein